MDPMDTSEPFNLTNANIRPHQHITTSGNRDGFNQVGTEEKMTVVHQEMIRMNKLPKNSNYVTHRLRVLNKIKELLSTKRNSGFEDVSAPTEKQTSSSSKRTTSQDEELELLFAGLSV